MGLFLWNNNSYFKKLPSKKIITRFGKRRWDTIVNYNSEETGHAKNEKVIFTMPSFAKHGRWGNIVFQYLFIRILASQNNANLELFSNGEKVKYRMSLYEDLKFVPTVQTKTNTVLLDNYSLLEDFINYIPNYVWRAAFISNIKNQQCYIVAKPVKLINQPLINPSLTSAEVEGLFLIHTEAYQPHKKYILDNFLQPTLDFKGVIDLYLDRLGRDKNIVGVHIRRGDFVSDPLNQPFQLPVPVKHINSWLSSNIASIENAVIFVCSDDETAYKEIEMGGFKVFNTRNLFTREEITFSAEQLEWEILRQCNILLTSNSTFSFSAALLNNHNPDCYRFSFTEKVFVQFDPWNAQPLEVCAFSPTMRSYLGTRFNLTKTTVSDKSAYKRLYKDVKNWFTYKSRKFAFLYYRFGFSKRYFGSILNIADLVKISDPTINEIHFTELKHSKFDKK